MNLILGGLKGYSWGNSIARPVTVGKIVLGGAGWVEKLERVNFATLATFATLASFF